MNLLGRCKIVPAVVPTAGSVAAITATEVDGTGFDRAMWIFETGAMAANGTYDIKVQKAAATGMAGAADITGAALTQVLAATGASKCYAIDLLIDPAKPFMKCSGAVGTATAANSAVCILYEGSGAFPKTAATEAIIVS